jgi:ABC-type transport system involved in multi-copper enzyme maturation permease subunit
MRQFLAILNDSFRLLRARTLFWISLGVSAFAAIIYLSIGFDDKGITLAFGLLDFEMEFAKKGSKGAELLYYGMFSNAIVGIWLTWIATILALISCAPVFPEFMEEGSAGVTLSKPVSRPLLFLYKFIGGLLFMAIQVTLFVVIVFFAIKLRLGVWNPSVFWSVPIVLLVFSYLYAVMVWLGIKTRSVMASVLLTLLFWIGSFVVLFAESITHQATVTGKGFLGTPLSKEGIEGYEKVNKMFRVPYAVLPKTSETVGLLDRLLVLGDGDSLGKATVDAIGDQGMISGDESQVIKDDLERHSPAYVIGTSLLFELVVLLLAMRSFCRRDF